MLAEFAPVLLRTTRQTEPHHRDSHLPALSPRQLHPTFHGCYDWHSAVHSHWSMARLLASGVEAEGLREHLAGSLTAERMNGEVATLEAAPDFEVPYGLAWVLMLEAELVRLGERELAGVLAPLAALSRRRLHRWLAEPLVESGLHHQTAFSLWLMLEAATVTHDASTKGKVLTAATRHWGPAAGRSLVEEAGPTDFLSPGLAAAVLMASTIDDFPRWLHGFLPNLAPELVDVLPATNDDPTDGHQTHLDGLNLNRAWSANRIAAALPHRDPRRAPLAAFSKRHETPGLAASTTQHFAGAHWLPTFAILHLTDANGEAGAASG